MNDEVNMESVSGINGPAEVPTGSGSAQSATTLTKKWYKNPWVWVGIAAAVIFIVAWPALFISGFFDKADSAEHDKAGMTMTPTPTVAMSMTPTPTPVVDSTPVPTSTPAQVTTAHWMAPDNGIGLSYPKDWTVKTEVAASKGMPNMYEYSFSFNGQEVMRVNRGPFGLAGETTITPSEIRTIATGGIQANYYNANQQEDYWWGVFTATDGVQSAVKIKIAKSSIDSSFVKDVLASVTGLTSQLYPKDMHISK